MLDPQAKALLQLMVDRGVPPVNTLPPQEARDFYVLRKTLTQPDPPAMSHVHDHLPTLGGVEVPVREYRPASASPKDILPALVYYHGGGWVLGNVDSHDGVCRALAMQSECAVLSVEYRLAPEFPFPIPLTDSVTATRWAYDNAASIGCDATRIAVGGDSAGGNFAAIIANMQVIPCVYQLLIYPVTDCQLGHPSHQENKNGPFLTHAGMKWFVKHYLSGDQGTTTDTSSTQNQNIWQEVNSLNSITT
jgi:acetyl esterase